jgi:hypothetical protein
VSASLRSGGLLIVFLLSAGCASEQTVRLSADTPSSRLAKRYPGFFRAPRGVTAVGFSPLGAFASDSSQVRAARAARKQLGWFQHVRVRGEGLSGSTSGGGGVSVELLETGPVPPTGCYLDTLRLDGFTWVLASVDDAAGFGGGERFPKKRPNWVDSQPQDENWHYGLGIAEVSYVDEPGSWDLATYRALLDLAFAFSRMGVSRGSAGGMPMDAYLTETDVSLDGARVVKRWRDQTRAFVLLGVPADDLLFRLEH